MIRGMRFLKSASCIVETTPYQLFRNGIAVFACIFGFIKTAQMKKLFFFAALLVSITATAQESDAIKPAAKGVVYGDAITTAGTAIDVNSLQSKLAGGTFEGKITGTVKEVCKAMGCWMKLEKEDGTTVMVKSKDHGYLMPQNLVGKTVVVEGTASVKEVTEATRKHLAEDAGKSKEEIGQIKGTEKELQVVARGVEVLD